MTSRTKPSTAKPTDIAVLIVMSLHGRERQSADEVSHGLRKLGFVVSSQQVASQLARMAREECPCVEAEGAYWAGGVKEYKLTRFANTLLNNHYRGRCPR